MDVLITVLLVVWQTEPVSMLLLCCMLRLIFHGLVELSISTQLAKISFFLSSGREL